MTASAKVNLLDLSRLIRRSSEAMTGIDRVEHAYLTHFVAQDEPAFVLVRSSIGFLLLDKSGMRKLLQRFDGEQPWGKPSVLMQVLKRGKSTKPRNLRLPDARRFAIARCSRHGLARLLRRNFPDGARYFNVSHTNLTERVFRALKSHPGISTNVMLHDTIPLDFPEYAGNGTVELFGAMLRRIRANADVLICNSEDTREALERHVPERPEKQKILVAHLGVSVAEPVRADLPAGFPPKAPYFVIVSTIEPRKNHMLLLNIWAGLHKELPPNEIPHLLICGGRGWNNQEVFHRLDTWPFMGQRVHELSGLSDGAIAALLSGATGALFPSFAEGFGLPPAEAAAMGVPTVCADLPVYREILGNIPVYASPKDSYLWRRAIINLTQEQMAGEAEDQEELAQFVAPTWDAHFNTVLKFT